MGEPASGRDHSSEGDLGAPIGITFFALGLVVAAFVVSFHSSASAYLYLAAIFFATIACLGTLMELGKKKSRDSFVDLGAAAGCLGLAALLFTITVVFNTNRIVLAILLVVASLLVFFGLAGCGIGVSKVLDENWRSAVRAPTQTKNRADERSPQQRKQRQRPMSRYERLSLVLILVSGLLTAVATLASAFILKDG